MRLGKYLSGLTMPELEELRNQLNLTEDEEEIFNYLSKGKSNAYTAEKCGISSSTLDNRIKDMRKKIIKIKGVLNEFF